MSTSKWTPGPWEATHGTKMVSAPAKGFMTVAKASVGQSRTKDGVITVGPEEAAANARLIASAPEMLAMLKSVRARVAEEVENFGPCDHDVNICVCGDRNLLADIDATLAKAEA